ncbi:MAG TPA: nucleotidyltransferase domain-containing protein [Thermoplasmata archaeon]|nr:nucleotidyltransferase domain-containing protein [Thermoplasmata archaeon]
MPEARPKRSQLPVRPTGRNPPASAPAHREVVRFVGRLAAKRWGRGDAAVLLAGSWSRGEAHVASDVDLWVVSRKPPSVRHQMLYREGRLVSVKFSTPAEERKELRDPGHFDGAVPGWRSAKIVRDPTGIAARLQGEARRFRWSLVRSRVRRYVGDQLAEWAEEVTKLVRALDTGERETASVQRNLISNRMAFLRLLPLGRWWTTENGLWERAGHQGGAAFRRAQRSALGTDGSGWRESCEAALRLYSLTARAHWRYLSRENRRVVEAACRVAGYPIHRVPS